MRASLPRRRTASGPERSSTSSPSESQARLALPARPLLLVGRRPEIRLRAKVIARLLVARWAPESRCEERAPATRAESPPRPLSELAPAEKIDRSLRTSNARPEGEGLHVGFFSRRLDAQASERGSSERARCRRRALVRRLLLDRALPTLPLRIFSRLGARREEKARRARSI